MSSAASAQVNDGVDHTADFANKSTIHGVKDLVDSKSIGSRTFWALVLIGATVCIPSSVISLLRDFENAPTMTAMSTVKYPHYQFPLVRFCPQSWVNASRLSETNLTSDAFLYALSLLHNVRLNAAVSNIYEAEIRLFMSMKQMKYDTLEDVYLGLAYNIHELFDCYGCASQSTSLTVLGVCYDFRYEDYLPTDIVSQNKNYYFVYYPPLENYSDPSNPNNMYNTSYAAHVLYIDVHPLDFFGFDPLFLNSDTSYTLDMKPEVSVRLPNTGERRCLDEKSKKSKEISFDMCQSNCRESLYGPRCWGYVHFGLSRGPTVGRKRLPWFSSLNRKPEETNPEEEACERRFLDELTKCMDDHCRSDCHQWHYPVTVAESNEAWNLGAPLGVTKMTSAEYVFWYRRGSRGRRGRGENVTHVAFQYHVHHGVLLTEEKNRKSFSAVISNVGGILALVVGAGALSVFQLLEFIAKLCSKRSSSCGQRSYAMSVGGSGSAAVQQPTVQ